MNLIKIFLIFVAFYFLLQLISKWCFKIPLLEGNVNDLPDLPENKTLDTMTFEELKTLNNSLSDADKLLADPMEPEPLRNAHK